MTGTDRGVLVTALVFALLATLTPFRAHPLHDFSPIAPVFLSLVLFAISAVLRPPIVCDTAATSATPSPPYGRGEATPAATPDHKEPVQ